MQIREMIVGQRSKLRDLHLERVVDGSQNAGIISTVITKTGGGLRADQHWNLKREIDWQVFSYFLVLRNIKRGIKTNIEKKKIINNIVHCSETVLIWLYPSTDCRVILTSGCTGLSLMRLMNAYLR